jgi:ribose 5-phosphate isomerase A
VTVDGADEVDPNLDMIKGYGGALVREKIVATSSRRLIIVVGPGKRVPRLGTRGKLPIEVVPFGLSPYKSRMAGLGIRPEVRRGADGAPYLTDNANLILDCGLGPIGDYQALEGELRATPGVVGTGLFLGMAEMVLIQDGDDVEVLRRDHST